MFEPGARDQRRTDLMRKQGLENLKKLKILSIQSNRITKLEGLEGLENLEELYLSHNGIQKLEGLEKNVSRMILLRRSSSTSSTGETSDLGCWDKLHRSAREHLTSHKSGRTLGTFYKRCLSAEAHHGTRRSTTTRSRHCKI